MSNTSKKSAGLLLYRKAADLEVLLVHPGGPFWAKKDEASWSIPKGEFSESEDPLAAAKREFEEEMGALPLAGDFEPLEPVKQPSGKLVFAWTTCSDFDTSNLKSNMFSMEWPPKSGRQQEFPEVDRADWFGIEAARHKILKGQAPFLDQLLKKLQSCEGFSVSSEWPPVSPRAVGRAAPKQQSLFGEEM